MSVLYDSGGAQAIGTVTVEVVQAGRRNDQRLITP
jgi:hypothetical protein